MSTSITSALATSTRWRTSTQSQGQDACVEVTGESGWVGVRDTKLGDASPILAIPVAHYAAFVAQAPDTADRGR